MATTGATRLKKPAAKSKDTVLSIRVGADIFAQLSELAVAMERPRASICAIALREFVEREYPLVQALRAGEQDIESGRVTPHEKVRDWLDSLAAGCPAEPPLRVR